MMQRSSFPRMAGVWGCFAAGLAGVPLAGWSQEALRSAVIGDRSYTTRSAPLQNPEEYHIAGPLSYRLGLSYSLEWMDNVFHADTNKESDFAHTPQLDFDARWQITQESMLHFGTGISYRKYQETEGQDRLGVTPNSELAWDIRVKDWVFTLYDRFNYSQDVISQGTLTGIAAFPRFENTAGVRASWRPNAFGVQLGYGHENYFSSSSQFTYLDRTSEQFFSRFGYSFAAQTEAGLEVTGGLVNYSDTVQSDNQNVSVGPFVSWQVTKAISLDLRGGYVTYDFDPSDLQANPQQLNSYYAGLGARYQITQHIVDTLDINKEVQQALNQGGQFIEQLTIRNGIGWAFHKHATFGGDVFYTRGKEPRVGFEDRYHQLGFGTTVRYEITDNLAPSLRYSYARRNSNQSGRDYVVNSVVFSITYRF
ncbi:MAG: outer membrane beta-barrel protein [Verrucomicrobiales bacterium]|nr:outer membrane beta-barrel protein [Verrucomicrobiales bacterium]